jgi:hypothetical protein
MLDMNLWKQFCSFDTVLGKILSTGKVHEIRRKARESATKVHLGGQCAKARQNGDTRIKKT